MLRGWADSSEFLASLDLPHRVTLVPNGSNAAAIGAALVGATGTVAEPAEPAEPAETVA